MRRRNALKVAALGLAASASLPLTSLAKSSRGKCVLPKLLKDDFGHSDPVIWGLVVRMTATGMVVRNDARPNAEFVPIYLNNNTAFFDKKATQIERPSTDAEVYVWVWLENCATDPSRYPAAVVIVGPLKY